MTPVRRVSLVYRMTERMVPFCATEVFAEHRPNDMDQPLQAQTGTLPLQPWESR
jgi:hypothetical protein